MYNDPLQCEGWKTQKTPIVLQFAKKLIFYKKTKNSWKRTWQTRGKKKEKKKHKKFQIQKEEDKLLKRK